MQRQGKALKNNLERINIHEYTYSANILDVFKEITNIEIIT